jgi:prevent-host-death family protein
MGYLTLEYLLHVKLASQYITPMTDISITSARADLAETIKSARKKPIRITSRGQTQAVIISPSLYEKMIEAMEEIEDLSAYDAALADKEPAIPWEQVKKDLGL